MKTFVPEEKPASRAKTVAVVIVIAILAALWATGKLRITIGEPTQTTVTPDGAVVPAEKKVAAHAKTSPGLKLLEKADIEQGTVNGVWTLKDGELQSDKTSGARFQIPVDVPDEYDLVCDFTRMSGNSTFNLLLTRRGRKFGYCIGWQDASCHFFDVHRPGANPTSRPFVIQNGRRYSVRIEVRDYGLTAYIDQKKMAELKTNYSDMGRWDGWDLKNNNFIGIGTWDSPAVIHALNMFEVKSGAPAEKLNEF